MTKRLEWVDVVKGLGIMLVVLAHTRFPTKELTWLINSFHMPLFFVIAGLCYDENRYSDLLVYLKRKFMALVYPYLTLSLLVMGLMSVAYFGTDPQYAPSQLFRNMLRGTTGGAFWFITVLLEVELAYALLAKWIKTSWGRLIVTLSVSLCGAYLISRSMPYLVDTACVAIFFYALGHFCRPVALEVTSEPSRSGREVLSWLGTTAVHVSLVVFVYRYKATFASRDFAEPSFYFVLAVLGAFSLISFSILLDRWTRIENPIVQFGRWFLMFLGRNTIVILATHNFLGICRSSWKLNGVASQVLEFMILGMLLYLLSGPCHVLISPKLKRVQQKDA